MPSNWSRRRFTSVLAALGLESAVPGMLQSEDAPPFKLGIITDEVTEDFEEALQFMARHSLAHAELRMLWGKNIMALAPAELRRARELLRQYRVRVAAIDSPLFKYDLPEMPAPLPPQPRDLFGADYSDQDTPALLKHGCELAHFFETTKVRVFSYYRVAEPERAYPLVRARLAGAAEEARRKGVVLMVENEMVCNIGTGRAMARLVREVHSPHLRGNWDPANGAVLGEVIYPDAYREVRGLFVHMHVKSFRRDPQSGGTIWSRLSEGVLDYHGLLCALRADGYTGVLSLETHYRRPDGNAAESSREVLEELRKVIAEVRERLFRVG